MANRSRLLSMIFATTAVIMAGCQAIAPTPSADQQPGTPSPTLPAPTLTVAVPEVETPTAAGPVLGDRAVRAKDEMEIVFVPGGIFLMGSDESEVDFALEQCLTYGTNCARRYFSVEMPMHSVRFDSFWIDMTEVTSDQYQECVRDGGCEPAGCETEGDQFPVVCVTWSQAAAYCQWAGARLPTEAEWEYSARGPERNRYPWGSDFNGTLLNYCDSSCSLSKRDDEFEDGYAESAPVGSYPQGASWVGALDMAGNVWEMVADWNGDYSTSDQVNPAGPETGTRRVARGGSWHASPDHVRSSLRTHMGLSDSVDHAGFRCVQSPPQN